MSEIILETYNFPIPAAVLDVIQQTLRKHEVFCTCNESIDCYDALTFRREQAYNKTKIYALLDRNTLIDILSLARPNVNKCDERGRIGAAMMVFFQCSNILVEPCMALYENPAMADDELKLFRQADNVKPEIYTRIALGQIDKLPANSLPALGKPIPPVDYNQRLKGRRKFRIAILKIAELDVANLSPIEKMECFLQWSHEKFCFLIAPTLLAVMHFTPHRKSSVLRNLRAVDRSKALKSIQNAVWDIQIIFQWSRLVKKHQDEKTFYILCSRDAALKRIARILHANDNSEAKEKALRKLLVENWGVTDGTKILKLMSHFDKSIDDPIRSVNQNKPASYLEKMEQELENNFLAWRA